MPQKHTAVEVQDQSGNQLRAVSQENDFPLPPADELQKLHQFRPDLVDKVLEMTEKEAQARRHRWCTIDKYVHRQNMMSAGGSIAIALVAFCGAIYLAMNNHDWVAFGLVGSTLGVVVFAISRANK